MIGTVILFTCVLLLLASYSLISKELLSMKGTGMTGKEEEFSYPLFQTFGMFLAMSGALIIHIFVILFRIPFPGYVFKRRKKLKSSRSYKSASSYSQYSTTLNDTKSSTSKTDKLKDAPALQRTASLYPRNKYSESGSIINSTVIPTIPIRYYLLLAITAAFDLVTTYLYTAGLQYLDASMSQMLRGSAVLFVALLKQFALGHRLRKYQWVGVMWQSVAIVILSLTASFGTTTITNTNADTFATDSSISSSSSSSSSFFHCSNSLFGVILILIGTLVAGLQFVFEEVMLNLDQPISPLILIGMEGLWGVIICLFIAYPIAYITPGNDHGSFENVVNTCYMLMNNTNIQIVFISFLILAFIFNIMTVLVTLLMDSVWRYLSDSLCPILVWFMALFIHYSISPVYFEAWSNSSCLQIVGWIVLLYGTAVYSAPNPGSVRLAGDWQNLWMDFTDEYPTIIMNTSSNSNTSTEKESSVKNEKDRLIKAADIRPLPTYNVSLNKKNSFKKKNNSNNNNYFYNNNNNYYFYKNNNNNNNSDSTEELMDEGKEELNMLIIADPGLHPIVSTELRRGGSYMLYKSIFTGQKSMKDEGVYFFNNQDQNQGSENEVEHDEKEDDEEMQRIQKELRAVQMALRMSREMARSRELEYSQENAKEITK